MLNRAKTESLGRRKMGASNSRRGWWRLFTSSRGSSHIRLLPIKVSVLAFHYNAGWSYYDNSLPECDKV